MRVRFRSKSGNEYIINIDYVNYMIYDYSVEKLEIGFQNKETKVIDISRYEYETILYDKSRIGEN